MATPSALAHWVVDRSVSVSATIAGSAPGLADRCGAAEDDAVDAVGKRGGTRRFGEETEVVLLVFVEGNPVTSHLICWFSESAQAPSSVGS